MTIDIDKERAHRELIDAAEAVVARWYTPKWKDAPHTAEYINILRAAVERAASAPPVILPVPTRKLTSASNNALLALARHWKLDGDWMTCKGCKRSLIFSRDGELLNHADGCKNADKNHPWWQLRSILLGAQEPAPALQEGSEQPPEYAFTKAKLDQIATTLAESGARLAELQAKYPSEQPPEPQQEGQPAALRAAPASQQESPPFDWQPIETAPRDGTRLMLHYPNAIFTGVNVIGGRYNTDTYAKKPNPYWKHDFENLSGIRSCRENLPSHWAFPPAAPVEQTTSATVVAETQKGNCPRDCCGQCPQCRDCEPKCSWCKTT